MPHVERKISAICPKCYAVSYLGIETDYIDRHNSVYEIPCTCGARYFIQSIDAIDTGIADTIAILNKKGYKTAFSCEGHAKEKPFGYTCAYISFSSNDDQKILDEYPLPRTWMDDTKRTYGQFTIRYNKKMPKNRYYLSDIKKWAESLPVKSEKPGLFKYGYCSCKFILNVAKRGKYPQTGAKRD